MSPQQALELVDKVSALINGTRQDHINLQMAISVLRSVVAQNEELIAPKSEQGDEKAEPVEETKGEDAVEEAETVDKPAKK